MFWRTIELFVQKSPSLALRMEHYLDPIQFSHFAKSRKRLAKHSFFLPNPRQVGRTELQRCSPRKATGAIVVMWKCRPVLLIHVNPFSSSHCLQFHFQFFCFFPPCFVFPFLCFLQAVCSCWTELAGYWKTDRNRCPSEGQTNESGFGLNCKDPKISARLCLSLSIGLFHESEMNRLIFLYVLSNYVLPQNSLLYPFSWIYVNLKYGEGRGERGWGEVQS